MSRVALPVWNGRISPVFDTAKEILVVQTQGALQTARSQLTIGEPGPFARAARMARENIDVLLCGAISRPLAAILEGQGTRVFPFLSGDAEEILSEYLAGNLPSPRYVMPGCVCWGGGRRRRCGGPRGPRFSAP